jgi:bifunctional DNA-binding transcriptional regulator/antitoxin component of YhaV-PrlF toxin-antitoxin module
MSLPAGSDPCYVNDYNGTFRQFADSEVRRMGDKAMLVSMSADGRLTVPASARRALGLDGEAQFEMEVEHDSLVLRPAVVLAREDAWAYTPGHRRLLEQAHRDSREGRVREMTEEELLTLTDE